MQTFGPQAGILCTQLHYLCCCGIEICIRSTNMSQCISHPLVASDSFHENFDSVHFVSLKSSEVLCSLFSDSRYCIQYSFWICLFCLQTACELDSRRTFIGKCLLRQASMPTAHDGRIKVLIPLRCIGVILIIHALDLDPVPPHMRTWGGLVSTFTIQC